MPDDSLSNLTPTDPPARLLPKTQADFFARAADKVRSKFPHAPGVYLFQDQAGRVLYIGKANDLRARVGINAGNVVFRDGDYFGRTVNVAARIADYARPGEVLVSEEAKERWGGEGVRFEPIGPVALKGVREELALYTATRA